VLGGLRALLGGRGVVAACGRVCGLAGGVVGGLLVFVGRRDRRKRLLGLGQKDREESENF
jgi:hypothetical protein